MDMELMHRLACPYCRSGGLRLFPLEMERRRLSRRDVREVITGLIACPGCGRFFRVEQGVPSFFFAGGGGWLDSHLERWGARLQGLLNTDLPRDDTLDAVLADGDYWARFYRRAVGRGYRHFFDIRQPVAPLFMHGLTRTLHFSGPGGSYRHEHEPFTREVIGRLSPPGGLPWDGRVLEVGCGSGWLCLELARRGLRPVGLDTGMPALQLARSYALRRGHGIDYIHADGGRPPFADGAFDGLVGFQALHHIPQLPAAIGRLRRLLRPDGLAVIFEHRSDRHEGLSRLAERISERLVLAVSGRYHIRPTFPRSLSANEDCSLHQVDRALKGFRPIRRRRYFLFLQDLPGFAYFLCRRRRAAYRLAAWTVNGIDRLAVWLFPRHSEHVLVVGRRRPLRPSPPPGDGAPAVPQAERREGGRP